VDEWWKDLGFAPLAVVGVALGMHLFTAVGRVPAACGYCFETTLMPLEW